MKVCFISPSYLPTVGGTEVALYELGKRLVKKGCEITLVTLSSDNQVGYLDDSGVLICHVHVPAESFLMRPSAYYGRLFPPPFTEICALRSIMMLNKLKRFDVLHQFHVFYLGATSVFSKKILRKPLVTSLMGWDTYDPIHPLSKYLNPYLGFVISNSDGMVSPARTPAIYSAEQLFKKEIRIIPHGVDPIRFNPDVSGGVCRQKLGIAKSEIVVLSVQRLDKRKDLESLLYAIRRVVRENHSVKFLIVGKGKEKSNLVELARKLEILDRIVFLGFVDPEDLPEYYSVCDIFVLHSLYEQFGIVLVEAMACGKPVISTNVGAIPEVVENGRTGLLVEPKNPEHLAGAILKLADDAYLRKKMGVEGRQKVEREYDWDIIVDEYLEYYEQILVDC